MTEALYGLLKPINLHYAMNSDVLFQEAGHWGITVMLSGFGGDEGITHHGNGWMNELISTGQHSKLRNQIRGIAGHHGIRFYRQLIKVYINYHAPWLLTPFKKDWRRPMYRSFAIQKRLARKYRMRRRFFYTPSLPAKPGIRAMQYFQIMDPTIPERIEETFLLAQPHGIEYRYPFLDVKLLEFFYSLPSEYKYRDGMGRYLYRRAMKDILPEKIRMRTDKSGNTIPNVFERASKDAKLFRKIIDEGRLKNQYHYVDYPVLHKMLDTYHGMKASKRKDYGLRAFQSAMSVLILQKWQREGKIDIGIKC